MPSLITLSDELGTGHHAALAAKIQPGHSVVAVEKVRALTKGLGVHSVLECVGYEDSMPTALSIASRRCRGPGRRSTGPIDTFSKADVLQKISTISGGPAPARAYINNELMPDILEGKIEPRRVFDRVTNLDGVPDGYRAMNDRRAIKVISWFAAQQGKRRCSCSRAGRTSARLRVLDHRGL